jgi:hypothetical protein
MRLTVAIKPIALKFDFDALGPGPARGRQLPIQHLFAALFRRRATASVIDCHFMLQKRW